MIKYFLFNIHNGSIQRYDTRRRINKYIKYWNRTHPNKKLVTESIEEIDWNEQADDFKLMMKFKKPNILTRIYLYLSGRMPK